MMTVDVQAQLQIKLFQSQALYLQYAPITLTVEFTNTTDQTMLLGSEPARGDWLRFLVFDQQGHVVQPLQSLQPAEMTLAPGATQQVQVNLVPYYAIRATGNYQVQAVVKPGNHTPLMTGKLFFTVGKGKTIWSAMRYHLGVPRMYRLLRFLDLHNCHLYLRVEEPEQNLVYATVKLGRVIHYTDPEVLFDAEENLHIVHVIRANTYLYTKADSDGAILTQEICNGAPGQLTPTLLQDGQGQVWFSGAVAAPQVPDN